MASPGWYPDPQDPALLQYFDGQRWTGDQQPVAAPGEPPPGGTSPPPAYRPPQYRLPPPTSGYAVDYARGRWSNERGPRHSRRRWLIAAAVVVLLAGLATGGWFLLHKPKSAQYTFKGETIDQPDLALTQAEKALNVIVAQRHGAKNGDTRCYFALAEQPGPGVSKTDVDRSVRCGPVLFVDGDASRAYLSFPVRSAPGPNGTVVLTAAATPLSEDPAPPPSGYRLSRPDGRTPPAGATLKVPVPPPAQPGTLLATYLTGQQLRTAPADARMVSLHCGVELQKIGVVNRYGSGDDARSAPAGQRLVAFTYIPVPGQVGNASPTNRQLGISLGTGPRRPVPAATDRRVIVAAVPANGRAALVLDADGVRQTLALPGGRPGPSNLAVLRRDHLDASLSISKPMTVRFSGMGAPSKVAGTVTVTRALLGYWTDDGKHHASSPGRALLWMDFRFRVSRQSKVTGVDAPLLRIRPDGGAPISAQDLDPTAKVFAVFDVPADLTRGTVTISGTEAGKPSVTIATPVTFTVSIPK